MPANLTHHSAALRVCVDRIDDGRISGRVFSQRLIDPMVFLDMGGLLLQLDRVLDTQNFPQAFQRIRSFSKAGASTVSVAGQDEAGMADEVVSAAQGELRTFVLYVISRQNTTWQGRLDWLDGAAAAEFSSVLELIKLIDQRLCPRQ